MEWNGKEYYWYIAMNIFDVPHITHVVPFRLKNKKEFEWNDFKKENIN